MICMSARDVVESTGATLLVEGKRPLAGEVEIDSRRVGEGSLFVAFAGEKVDGNSYIDAALDAGAAVVCASAEPAQAILEHARRVDATLLRAEGDDCEEFLLRLAGAWRALHQDWMVVAVTGSVGKTTTKDMLRAGIATQRRVHATAGNHNNLIGLPMTILSAPKDAEVLVCECGMNHKGEIARLTRCCRPTIAVITNVGTSHIGLLGSRENIACAKAEIVEGMEAHGDIRPTLILESGGDFTSFVSEKFARPKGIDVVCVGSHAGDILRAQDVSVGEESLPTATFVTQDGWKKTVTFSVPGRVAVSDALMALEAITLLGLDRDMALDAIATMPPTRMRLSVLRAVCGARIIDDSYNASPSSMAAALDVLSRMPTRGRRIAILGEIGELGQEEKRLHGYVGAYVAAKPMDLVVFVGRDAAREMAEAAKTMGLSEDAIELVESVEDVMKIIPPILKDTDTVLVKASRAAGLDAFVRGVVA